MKHGFRGSRDGQEHLANLARKIVVRQESCFAILRGATRRRDGSVSAAEGSVGSVWRKLFFGRASFGLVWSISVEDNCLYAAMKKTNRKERKRQSPPADELRSEYKFDYRKAKPNRFAAKIPQGSRVVMLDADVAKIFTTPEAVNAVLRAIVQTMPSPPSRA